MKLFLFIFSSRESDCGWHGGSYYRTLVLVVVVGVVVVIFII